MWQSASCFVYHSRYSSSAILQDVFSFAFNKHCQHFDDFIITSETFLVSSKQTSMIPSLDYHPLVPHEPSMLVLILITWFRNYCLSIFTSIWPTVCRYRFTLKTSSFRLFSRSFSVTSVKTFVYLLQRVGCTGGCKLIKLSIFFAVECPFPVECITKTNILFISKYCLFFGLLCHRICWYHMP